jgi:hypothetical protein
MYSSLEAPYTQILDALLYICISGAMKWHKIVVVDHLTEKLGSILIDKRILLCVRLDKSIWDRRVISGSNRCIPQHGGNWV